jgi:hypothetical protein
MAALSPTLRGFHNDLRVVSHSKRVAWATHIREALRIHGVLTIGYKTINGQQMPIAATPEEFAVLFAKWGI